MEVVCPRCGGRGTLVVRKRGGRRYYYVVHYDGSRRFEHYAGPVSDYVYVSKTHSDTGLILRGPLDQRRVLEYIDVLIEKLEDIARWEASGRGQAGKITRTVSKQEVKERIRSWIDRLQALLEELEAEENLDDGEPVLVAARR